MTDKTINQAGLSLFARHYPEDQFPDDQFPDDRAADGLAVLYRPGVSFMLTDDGLDGGDGGGAEEGAEPLTPFERGFERWVGRPLFCVTVLAVCWPVIEKGWPLIEAAAKWLGWA